MHTAGTFLCDCGARLTIVTEGREASTAIACPTGTCKVRHVVTGEVRDVFIIAADGVGAV
jgi:hypothetical protein